MHLPARPWHLKRVLVHVAGFNLGLVMQKIAGSRHATWLPGPFLRLFAATFATIHAPPSAAEQHFFPTCTASCACTQMPVLTWIAQRRAQPTTHFRHGLLTHPSW